MSRNTINKIVLAVWFALLMIVLYHYRHYLEAPVEYYNRIGDIYRESAEKVCGINKIAYSGDTTGYASARREVLRLWEEVCDEHPYRGDDSTLISTMRSFLDYYVEFDVENYDRENVGDFIQETGRRQREVERAFREFAERYELIRN